MRKHLIPLAAALALTASSFFATLAQSDHSASHSAPVTLGALKITDAWTKAMLPGQPVGGGFLTIENTGAEADRLVSATTDVTPDLQIHEMKMDGDVMKMRQLADGLEIPAGAKVELKPGGYHLMFMKMKEPLKEGGMVKVRLKFEKAGEGELDVPILPANAKGASHDHGMIDDKGQIVQVLKATWETPEKPLRLDPVVIHGSHAIAGWQWDGKGGRALLKKGKHGWSVHLCTGDAVKDAENLAKMGVPADEAEALATSLGEAESKIDPAVIKLYSTFDGTVMMDGEGAHHHKG